MPFHQANTITVDASQARGVLRAKQLDPRAIGQITSKLSLVKPHHRYLTGKGLQIIKGDLFCLAICRRNVKEPRIILGAENSVPEKMIDSHDGLTSTAMHNNNSPTLLAQCIMQLSLQRPGTVGDLNLHRSGRSLNLTHNSAVSDNIPGLVAHTRRLVRADHKHFLLFGLRLGQQWSRLRCARCLFKIKQCPCLVQPAFTQILDVAFAHVCSSECERVWSSFRSVYMSIAPAPWFWGGGGGRSGNATMQKQGYDPSPTPIITGAQLSWVAARSLESLTG